jgi:hypothetical protein
MQLLLVGAVVVLAIAAGILLGLALRRRGRPRAREEAREAPGPVARSHGQPLASGRMATLSSPPPVPPASGARARSNPGLGGAPSASGAATPAASGAATGGVVGAIAVGASDRACPSCKTVYQDMIYCQKDARRLVPLEELAAAGRTGGLACPRCGRGFEHGLRRCPHDGGELVPLAMYQATRRRRDSGPSGVLAKVCPVCRRRFDLSARFCGRDGHELVVVN